MSTALRPSERAGVAVLLVYGLKVPTPRDGQPGFRITVQCDGAAHVEPVGFTRTRHAHAAYRLLEEDCRAIGLDTESLLSPGKLPGLIIRRRSCHSPQP